MRIAVASDGNRVSGHFGHCEGFNLYEVEDKNIVESTFIQNPGHKPGFLPNYDILYIVREEEDMARPKKCRRVKFFLKNTNFFQ